MRKRKNDDQVIISNPERERENYVLALTEVPILLHICQFGTSICIYDIYIT